MHIHFSQSYSPYTVFYFIRYTSRFINNNSIRVAIKLVAIYIYNRTLFTYNCILVFLCVHVCTYAHLSLLYYYIFYSLIKHSIHLIYTTQLYANSNISDYYQHNNIIKQRNNNLFFSNQHDVLHSRARSSYLETSPSINRSERI